MEEKQSFLKQKIDLESPNKNIVPITTSIEGNGELSIDVVIGTIFLFGLLTSIFCFKKDFFSSMGEFLIKL